MAPSRTRTIKNKHAAKSTAKSSRQPLPDPVLRSRGGKSKPNPVTTSTAKGRPSIGELLKKKAADRKKRERTYTDQELGIPKLNMITPVGVQKPRGKKKGKVFVDDGESMNTILAMVQAEKEGQIESKMIKARQMEEIREARRIEAEKKEADRNAKLEETKDSMRRKRKRPQPGPGVTRDDDVSIKDTAATGTRAAKAKKKRVAFAED